MKIAVFDIDGTYTKFDQFVLEKGTPYMEKKHQFQPVYPKRYDVDEVFDIVSQLQKKNSSLEEATLQCEKIKNSFWTSNFPDYALVYPFREGVKQVVRELHNNGVKIINVSSRFKTCRDDILGKAVRTLSKLQFLRNGVYYDHLVFVEDDEQKVELIKEINPNIAVDDKIEIIEELSKTIPTFCINSGYNEDITFGPNVFRTDVYDEQLALKMLEFCDREKESQITFQKRMQYIKK